MTAVTDRLRAFENTAIDAVSATTPWLAPLIPAAIAYEHMIDVLEFSVQLALVGAIVIEFLGLSAIHTAVQFWAFNQRRRKSDAPAPVWWPVAIGGFYLVLILTVNVILANAEWRHILAITLLSLVSVPAGFVIAVRAQHAAYIDQIAAERRVMRRRRADRATAKPTKATNPTPQENAGKRTETQATNPTPQYECECGTSYEKPQSYSAHTRHCGVHRRKAAQVYENGRQPVAAD